MHIFMQALPNAYKNIKAEKGTVVTLIVDTEIGGQWSIIKEDENWKFINANDLKSNAVLKIQPNDAWLLFSKGMKPQEAKEKVEITGDTELAEIALNIVAVMA